MELKTYSKPVLTKFGSVSSLTKGVNGSIADRGQSNTTKFGNG